MILELVLMNHTRFVHKHGIIYQIKKIKMEYSLILILLILNYSPRITIIGKKIRKIVMAKLRKKTKNDNINYFKYCTSFVFWLQNQPSSIINILNYTSAQNIYSCCHY